MDYVWDVRNPEGGMLGQEWARGVSEACDIVLAHALPSRVDVVVRDEDDRVVASGRGLAAGEDTPMSRLRLYDGTVTREAVWPTSDDLGRPVLLAGGEIGLLVAWWNPPDGSEWTWQLEFHNTRGGDSPEPGDDADGSAGDAGRREEAT